MTLSRLARAVLSALLLCACATSMAAPCVSEDFKTHVSGQGECLLIAAFGAGVAVPADPVPPRALIVWLHGDTSGGGPARSHVRPAQVTAVRYADGQVLSIAMWRPGYGDQDGRTSDGDNHGRFDNYTATNMAIVGDAIQRLKAYYKPGRLIVVGHSGGAATAANLLGMRPGLMDAAVLVACPCDLRAWRAGRRWWPRSEDPAAWAAQVAPPVKVVALTGSADDNTAPALAEQYVARLTARHVDARFIVIPDADHNSALGAAQVIDAVGTLLD